MAKKINEMTSDDLMTLPDDIEGIVLDVQGRQKQNAAPVQKPQEEPVAESTPVVKTEQKPTPTAMPKEGNEWWNTFLKCGEGYGYRVKKDGRKMYWIDEDIVTALKACDINRISAPDSINAIFLSSLISI